MGSGGAVSAVGAGPRAVVTLGLAGVGPVPDDATAVALNVVTDYDATVPSFVTMWPTGAPQPLPSVGNAVPGQTMPSMTLVRLGAGGSIDIFNYAGHVNVAVDLMGYFVPLSDVGGGAPGPEGPPGVAGPSGPSGPAATQTVLGTPVPVAPPTRGTQVNADATCPPGTVVLGGGGVLSGDTLGQSVGLRASVPTATGWTVNAQQNALGLTVWTLQAYVICSA